MVSYLLPLLYNLCKALPVRNNHSDRSDGICQSTTLSESCNNELYIELKNISESSFPSPQKSKCKETLQAIYIVSETTKTPGKRSIKELQNIKPIDAISFCKSAYLSNNGTKVVGTLENGLCRFDLKINECDDIRFNNGATFYRGIDRDGMCFFSQEDVQTQLPPDSPLLTKPKESIQDLIDDDGVTSNLTDATYQYIDDYMANIGDALLDHLLNIDYYDDGNDGY